MAASVGEARAVDTELQPTREEMSPPSPELAEFLKSGLVATEGLKSDAEWQNIRRVWREFTQPISDEARRRYISNVEEEYVNGVRTLVVTPNNYNPKINGNKKLVYIHGGAFTLGSPDHLFSVFAQIAFETGIQVVAVDYGLAPEFVFPGGINDCETVFNSLSSKGIEPQNTVLIGDSAGGNIALALANRLEKKPAGLVLFSPMTKATKSPSYDDNKDPRITYETCIFPAVHAYVKGQLELLNHPEIDVLNHENFKDLPPIFTQTGTRDAIADDSVSLVKRLKALGKRIILKMIPHACHGIVEQLDMPEAINLRHDAAEFIRSLLNN